MLAEYSGKNPTKLDPDDVVRAAIGEAPALHTYNPFRFVPEVEPIEGTSGRAVAVMHVFNASKDFAPLCEQGFKLRREYLMKHLLTSLEENTGDTPKAIRQAFSKMNSQLEVVFKRSPHSETFWSSQYTSVVVVVGDAHVYVAGGSCSPVFLSRNGEDIELTNQQVMFQQHLRIYVNRFGDSTEETTPMCYFHKEKLTKQDTYVSMCSPHVLAHVDGDLTPVLSTRVEAFGLEKACAEIAGESPDKSWTFIIIPLQRLIQEKLRSGVIREVEGELFASHEEAESEPGELGWIHSPPEPQTDDSEDEDEDDDEQQGYESSQIQHLRPLVHGRPQVPQPVTSCSPWPGRCTPAVKLVDILPLARRCFSVSYNSRKLEILHEPAGMEDHQQGFVPELPEEVLFQVFPRSLIESWSYIRGEEESRLVLRPAENQCYDRLIRIPLEDERLKSLRVVFLASSLETYRDLIASVDLVAFWDEERFTDLTSKRLRDKWYKPYGMACQ